VIQSGPQGVIRIGTYWNEFEFRDDDIIIATWAKAGTTWVQQIVANLIFEGETEGMPVGDMSPWLDFRLPPLEVKLPGIIAQKHRRFLKTHLPLDAFVFEPKVKHIYIGRDGRDCVWSMYNHHVHLNDVLYDGLNALPQPWGPVSGVPAQTTSGNTSWTGSTTTVTRSGHSGRTSARGGPLAPFPMCISSITKI
jgi:aryl sulfotransferase